MLDSFIVRFAVPALRNKRMPFTIPLLRFDKISSRTRSGASQVSTIYILLNSLRSHFKYDERLSVSMKRQKFNL